MVQGDVIEHRPAESVLQDLQQIVSVEISIFTGVEGEGAATRPGQVLSSLIVLRSSIRLFSCTSKSGY